MMAIAQWRKDLLSEVEQRKAQNDALTDEILASELTPKYGRYAKSGRITKNTVIGIRAAVRAEDDLESGKPIDFQALTRPAYEIRRPDHQHTDWDKWQKSLSRLEDKRYVKVAGITDVHRPFQDNDALALAFEMVYDFQPDVIPVGLDDLDYPNLSQHWQPDQDIDLDDWIESTYHDWTEHIDALDLIAPKADKPYVPGNHNWRAYDDMDTSKARTSLYNMFADVIRSDGRVQYFGRIDALEIGELTVRHVPKTTKYPAYATLEKYKFQRNLWCGHIHRPDESTVMVKRPVSSWIGGCLCDLKPHYGKLEEISTWQHAITLMTVDMKTGNVSGRNYVFQHSDTHIWCDTVHKTYSVRKQVAESEMAA